ncbi:hypothetical protein [Aquimarina aggregata]|uniref:hypothetical protein n=1 Tax=Aquimarina aggregata TaxID=1642818 RepID=UPI002491B686|nr:hypothetical protein [Aquimarina aggregata]
MKTINYFLAIACVAIVFSCKQASEKATETVTEEVTEATRTVSEEVLINVDENFTSKYSPKAAASIMLAMDSLSLVDFSSNYAKIDVAKEDTWSTFNDAIVNNATIPIECWNSRPKKIEELTDGVLLDAYSFERGDEVKLGLLGFLNVNLSKKQKAIVVEFSQKGTQYCSGKTYKYFVGARLMMKITRSKNNAKLNTPQQVTASVIFGRAEVIYSLKTFGIVGPGIAELNKVGSLSEDTYQGFMQAISKLIVDMYKEKSDFIITPILNPLESNGS